MTDCTVRKLLILTDFITFCVTRELLVLDLGPAEGWNMIRFVGSFRVLAA